MGFPHAYLQFLVHFHGDRDYFECHEVLEEYWKETDSKNRHSVWVGFIQMAVSLYHYRRKNQVGAIKLMEKTLKNFNRNDMELISLGIDTQILFEQLSYTLMKMKNGQSYQSINLPISNNHLIKICRNRCKRLGFQWCSMSDLENDFLINRHKLRDRSEVENERLASMTRKQLKRQQQLVHMNL